MTNDFSGIELMSRLQRSTGFGVASPGALPQAFAFCAFGAPETTYH